tara:strand:- start:266 stop:499 length:234 start_codon:yes stop_codon:yes gene_type:complete
MQYQPMTIGQWIITFLLCSIPLVNIIMVIVWAVSGSTHPSKKTWAQAYLIIMGISIILWIIIMLIIFVFGAAAASAY